MAHFGTLLKSLRERVQWKQEDLARAASVSLSTIQKSETRNRPSLRHSTYARLAQAFRMTPAELDAHWRDEPPSRLEDFWPLFTRLRDALGMTESDVLTAVGIDLINVQIGGCALSLENLDGATCRKLYDFVRNSVLSNFRNKRGSFLVESPSVLDGHGAAETVEDKLFSRSDIKRIGGADFFLRKLLKQRDWTIEDFSLVSKLPADRVREIYRATDDADLSEDERRVIMAVWHSNRLMPQWMAEQHARTQARAVAALETQVLMQKILREVDAAAHEANRILEDPDARRKSLEDRLHKLANFVTDTIDKLEGETRALRETSPFAS